MTFIDPRKVVENWDIRPSMKVADFGCGAGHYSIELAKRIGKEGIIYAFDIQSSVLSALKGRAALEHLSNIEPRRVDLELEKGTQLADGIIDLVVMSNILFQAENKEAVVKEALRILRPAGSAAVIEWIPVESKLGPPKEQSLDKEETKEIFIRIGFNFDRQFDVGEYHYGLIFKK